jgi:hypothetical protein
MEAGPPGDDGLAEGHGMSPGESSLGTLTLLAESVWSARGDRHLVLPALDENELTRNADGPDPGDLKSQKTF